MPTRHLKVSIECLRLPLAPFIICARSTILALTDSEYYPDVFPPLEVVSEAVEDLAAKAIQARNRDQIALAFRNEAWMKAGLLLRQLASYVQAHCQNDLVVLLRSGFVPTRRRSPVGPLSKPGNLRGRITGMTGEAKLLFDPVYGARGGYEVQLAETANGPFTDYASTMSSRILLKNLPPMTYRWVRVRAFGTAGPSPWSEPLRLTII